MVVKGPGLESGSVDEQNQSRPKRSPEMRFVNDLPSLKPKGTCPVLMMSNSLSGEGEEDRTGPSGYVGLETPNSTLEKEQSCYLKLQHTLSVSITLLRGRATILGDRESRCAHR